MAGEGGNKVRVLDLPIDVSGEGAAGQMAGCNLVQRMLDLRAGSIPARGTKKDRRIRSFFMPNYLIH